MRLSDQLQCIHIAVWSNCMKPWGNMRATVAHLWRASNCIELSDLASHRNWFSSHSGHSEECSSAKSAQSALPWLEGCLDLPWSRQRFGFSRDQFPKRLQFNSECRQKLPSQRSWGLRNLVEARQEPQSSPSSLPSPQSSSPLQNRSLQNAHSNMVQIYI